MKTLFASLFAAVFALAAVSVYAATPIAPKVAFAPDTGSALPSEEDKDKDEKKKDG